MVQREAELADAEEQGSFYHNLVALVFASLAVEGNINYAGARLAPEAWKDERKYFSQEPYRGLTGKLKKVSELVSVTWDPEAKPLKSILELKNLRDLIAHAKPEKHEGTLDHSVEVEYKPLTGDFLSKRITKCARIAGLQAVEQFVEALHLAARNKTPHDPYFRFEALGGPTTMGGWVTGAKE